MFLEVIQTRVGIELLRQLKRLDLPSETPSHHQHIDMNNNISVGYSWFWYWYWYWYCCWWCYWYWYWYEYWLILLAIAKNIHWYVIKMAANICNWFWPWHHVFGIFCSGIRVCAPCQDDCDDEDQVERLSCGQEVRSVPLPKPLLETFKLRFAISYLHPNISDRNYLTNIL